MNELIKGMCEMMKLIYREETSLLEYDNKVIIESSISSIVIMNNGDVHLISNKYGFKKFVSFNQLTKYLNDIYFA